MNYLNLAHEAWLSGGRMRENRQRCKRFAYGRQWDEPMRSPDGRIMTEGDYAALNGQRPMSNNLIRQMVKNLIGYFRSSDDYKLPADDGLSPQAIIDNQLDELDSRLLEEFLISGCAIQRVTVEKRLGGTGVWVDNVSPDRFFVNPHTDPRGGDIEVVGMLHDMGRHEMMARFGGKKLSADELWHLYGIDQGGSLSETDFYTPQPGKCRVIEVWTLEARSATRCFDPETRRLFMVGRSEAQALKGISSMRKAKGLQALRTNDCRTLRWHCRYYAPSGVLLDEMDSPYRHQLHPYAVKLYPLTDGEVHSCVEDVIDQQRYVNRLVTLMDHILSVSAKGVLLYPLDAKPDDMTWDEIAETWSDCRGILPYRIPLYGNAMPQQIMSPGGSAGASELLKLQMDMFKQISGVHGPLQGQMSGSAMSASLFDAQTRNARVALHDIFETFQSFRRSRNRLMATA